MFKAIVTTPRSSVFGVQFYVTEGSEGPQDWKQPSMYCPCYSYEHAQAVASAYNNPPPKRGTLDLLGDTPRPAADGVARKVGEPYRGNKGK